MVAKHIPFEAVEQFSPPVPEQLQLRIAFRSFPNDTEDIRLYACLANGTADEFLRGEVLAKSHSAVQMCLQIGFYLTASVVTSPDTLVRVSVTFDRQKIVSCECECDKPSPWCHHVVAVCLHRILKVSTQVGVVENLILIGIFSNPSRSKLGCGHRSPSRCIDSRGSS